MSDGKTEQLLQGMARAIDDHFSEVLGRKVGFALFVFEFNKPGICNYVSNTNHKDMIKAMRETLARFESQE